MAPVRGLGEADDVWAVVLCRDSDLGIIRHEGCSGS
jgi:hypothetical protein